MSKIDRIRVPDRAADEWGVTPDEGQLIELPPAERERLRAYLDSRAFLLPRDPVGRDPLGDFTDRQRDRALDHLRRRFQKGS